MIKTLTPFFMYYSIFLAACADHNSEREADEAGNSYVSSPHDTVESNPPYDGPQLHIALIGKEPEITESEEDVTFHQIGFEDLATVEKPSAEGYDAVFIKHEHLEEAARPEHRNSYEELTLPIFFVESEARYLPFINMKNHISYEEHATRINDEETFISGIWYPEDEKRHGFAFDYMIEDGEREREETEGVYSRVFKAIATDFEGFL
ncbi:hypothetical protein [Salsuginibacillus kocurii]|uniref:hypothetical protein n=1 Tax=Salsuginibacillus kocurii TaxID=427078 RepID=UPI000371DE16|nr:hypothetical protein [Salsuginibacillus kocurii]